jgi:hypothetical protein
MALFARSRDAARLSLPDEGARQFTRHQRDHAVGLEGTPPHGHRLALPARTPGEKKNIAGSYNLSCRLLR